MIIIFVVFGVLMVCWFLFRFFKNRIGGVPFGKRIAIKVDKTTGEIFEVWLVDGRIELKKEDGMEYFLTD